MKVPLPVKLYDHRISLGIHLVPDGSLSAVVFETLKTNGVNFRMHMASLQYNLAHKLQPSVADADLEAGGTTIRRRLSSQESLLCSDCKICQDSFLEVQPDCTFEETVYHLELLVARQVLRLAKAGLF